jgi:Tol biopolymer transport system component
LTSGPGGDQFPKFSPDGKWILYARNEPPDRKKNMLGRSSLRLIRADGSEDRELMSCRGDSVGGTNWSPSGKWASCEMFTGPVSVSLIHPDRGDELPLVIDRDPREWNLYHTWAPDERWVAYARKTVDGRFQLCKISTEFSRMQTMVRRLDAVKAKAYFWWYCLTRFTMEALRGTV